MCELVMIAFV